MFISVNPVKFALVGVAAAMLAACGGDEPEKASKAPAQAAAAAPAKAEFVNPYQAKLDALEEVDRSQYFPVQKDLNIALTYLKLRTWEEKPDDVAGSFIFSGVMMKDGKATQYEEWVGLDSRLQIANFEYLNTDDVFKKRDHAVHFSELIKQQIENFAGGRLVKIELRAKNMGIQAYNFDDSSFEITSCMISDKVDHSAEEIRQMRSGMSPDCLKGYLSNSLAGNYRVGIIDGNWLKKISVADEQSARAIEKMRSSGLVVFYGYVAEVRREARERNGEIELEKVRTLEIVPSFVDFVDDGKVVYTARKS